MKIILTKTEQKLVRNLQCIGEQGDMKVYDHNHKVMLHATITILCDCGKNYCEHKKMLLVKMLKEYKVKK